MVIQFEEEDRATRGAYSAMGAPATRLAERRGLAGFLVRIGLVKNIDSAYTLIAVATVICLVLAVIIFAQTFSTASRRAGDLRKFQTVNQQQYLESLSSKSNVTTSPSEGR